VSQARVCGGAHRCDVYRGHGANHGGWCRDQPRWAAFARVSGLINRTRSRQCR